MSCRPDYAPAGCNTAQETLFILKNAGVFGTTAGPVYQVGAAAVLWGAWGEH
jgi:hypothetical protein